MFYIQFAGAEYPSYWVPHEEKMDFVIYLLDEDSEEYQSVENHFLATLPTAEIKRIDRIQNRVLWRKYIDKGRQMNHFEDGVLNEVLLFHGSGSHSPELIYQGDASFDLRYSRDGMWGKGNYFAVNASYSDSYAFNTKSTAMPCKKMLVAWVLTGHSYYSEPTHSYLPNRQNSSEGHVCRRYDSVNGVTGGSKVYITYDNNLAYPAYLITYTK